MNKRNTTQKLHLRRETIATMRPSTLAAAVGAGGSNSFAQDASCKTECRFSDVISQVLKDKCHTIYEP